MAVVQCTRCGAINRVAPASSGGQFQCHRCGAFLPGAVGDGETSAAVGLIGGAALGAAIGGAPGAIIGAVLGSLVGKNSRGVG